MRTGEPQTALAAATWRRLLVSSWPWRCAAYLLTTLPVAVPAFVVLGIPWLVLVARLGAGDRQLGTIVFLVLFGAALIGGLGPLIAAPLARVERARLLLVDNRRVESDQPTAPPIGSLAWLRARYTDPASWREVAYAWLLALVFPVLSIAALLTVPLSAVFITSPFLLQTQRPGDTPVALGFGEVATVGETAPYVVVGAVMLPLIPYLFTLLTGGHAAVARGLLTSVPAEQLQARLVEVASSRARLADAFDAERNRIQRDLHDGAQQKLVSLSMQLGLARLDLPPDSPAAGTVASAHEQAKQLMAELRAFIHGIQPQVLTELGLPAALEELADRAAIPVTVQAHLSSRLPSRIEKTAYFAAAEALTNVAKHSGATCASVAAWRQADVLVIEISDNGSGGADQSAGTGLTGLADRVAVTGGRMLLSSPPGGPTLLRVELPCRQT